MDTCLHVVNAAAAAQGRSSRAARSRTEAVVVWSTCHERVGMPEHPVSATFSSQVSAWADQLLRTGARSRTKLVLFRARGGGSGQGLRTLRAVIRPCVRPGVSSASSTPLRDVYNICI